MTALTAQQRNLLRRRVGDTNAAFTDPTLDQIWDEVSGASSDAVRIEAALYLMWDAIVAGSVKLHDFKAGQSDEKLSQVFNHAMKMRAMYQSAYDAATNQRPQVAIATIRPVTNPRREYPCDDGF